MHSRMECANPQATYWDNLYYGILFFVIIRVDLPVGLETCDEMAVLASACDFGTAWNDFQLLGTDGRIYRLSDLARQRGALACSTAIIVPVFSV